MIDAKTFISFGVVTKGSDLETSSFRDRNQIIAALLSQSEAQKLTISANGGVQPGFSHPSDQFFNGKKDEGC